MDCHPAANQTPLTQQQAALNQCLLAEKLGYETYFIAEHHFTQYGIMPSPFVFLASLATITQKIKLGLGVAVAPFHDARRLAEDAAQLDLLCQGRMMLGLGSGFDQREFNGFGINIAEKRDKFNETKTILTELLSRKQFPSLTGKYHQGNNVVLNIPTYDNVMDRTFTASAGTKGAYYIGLQGDNLLLSPFETINSQFSDLEDAISNYNQGLKEANITGKSNVVTMFCHVAETDEQAKQNCLEAFDRYVSSRSPQPLEIKYPGQFYDGYVGNKLTLIGGIDTVVEQMKKVQQAGVDELALLFNFGGIENSLVEQSMENFITKVAPQLS